MYKRIMEINQGFENKPCASLDEYESLTVEAYEFSHDNVTDIIELRLEAGFNLSDRVTDIGDNWADAVKGRRR